jgi:hypothetical protein
MVVFLSRDLLEFWQLIASVRFVVWFVGFQLELRSEDQLTGILVCLVMEEMDPAMLSEGFVDYQVVLEREVQLKVFLAYLAMEEMDPAMLSEDFGVEVVQVVVVVLVWLAMVENYL